MLLLSLLACLAVPSAPSVEYQLEPWDAVRPFWSDPIIDSVLPGRPVFTYATQHAPTGALTGLDTFEISTENGQFHSRSIYWTFQNDTTRAVNDSWFRDPHGHIDSFTQESFQHDTSRSWSHLSSSRIPGGILSLMDYGPNRTSLARIDSFYKWFDESGRKTSTRTVRPAMLSQDTSLTTHYVGLGALSTNAIEWGMDGAPRVWRTFDSSRSFSDAPFRVRRTEHWLSWDGQKLVRDSTWSSTRDGNALPTISTSVLTCTWEESRLQECRSSLGGSSVTWDRNGRPLSRFGDISTLWGWDSRGRMTRIREWGTETDLDSLDYGTGPWPTRRRSYTCYNKSPWEWDSITQTATLSKDSCVLREVADYTYSLQSVAGIAPHRRPKTGVQRAGNGLVWYGLDPRTHQLRLTDLAGRTLTAISAKAGTARLTAPAKGGLTVWIAEDARGTPLATGRIALP